MKKITITFLAIFILLSYSACKKEYEQNAPTGWQASMRGKILYSKNSNNCFINNSDRLFIIDNNGKKGLTPHGDYNCIRGAKWSPDGSKIIFGQEHGFTGIKMINSDATGERILYEHNYGYGIFNIDWSPDGDRIAFINPERTGIIDPDGNLLETLFSASGVFLDWSPDGNKIAFDKAIEGFGGIPGGAKIQIFDLTTDSIIEIHDYFEGTTEQPAWSTDGMRIAFRHKSQIYISDADGKNIRQITRFTKTYPEDKFIIYQTAWSPDDQMLAIGTRDGVYIVNLNGEIISLIPQSGEGVRYVDWHE